MIVGRGIFLTGFVVITLVTSFVHSGHHSAPGTPTGTSTEARVIAPRPVEHLEALPQATTFTTLNDIPIDVNSEDPTDGSVVHPRYSVPVYTQPGGPAVAALPPQEISSDTWVPVIAREDGWVQVLLPSRPNGSTGWMSTQDSSLAVADSPYRIEVDRGTFRLTLLLNNHPVGSWTVGVGKDSASTPTGRTFLMASITDSRQTYSPVILPLGIHSTAHDTFGGGPGTTAIHTWPQADVFGTRSSDGCIRVPADALQILLHSNPPVSLGTPVLIH
jgi:lipoprotein-anchoring transpeptidase ErfK/SrfK